MYIRFIRVTHIYIYTSFYFFFFNLQFMYFFLYKQQFSRTPKYSEIIPFATVVAGNQEGISNIQID